jgi:hypothetical protein
MVNANSDTSLNRIYQTPKRGIGATGWSTLRSEVCKASSSSSLGKHLFEGLENAVVSQEIVQEVCWPASHIPRSHFGIPGHGFVLEMHNYISSGNCVRKLCEEGAPEQA